MTSQSLDSLSYCYVIYLSLPATLIYDIATTRVRPPTWAPPVSDPESASDTRGHLFTSQINVEITLFLSNLVHNLLF